MPAININELRYAIPRYANEICEPDVALKYPLIGRLRLFATLIEITDRFDRIQRFRIKWARTGFGRHRPILLCNSCGRGVIRLFFRYGTYACRHCHKALYASQKNNQIGRNASQPQNCACNSAPSQIFVSQCLPSPNGHRTYQRIRNEIQALERKANTRRFRKPLSSQLFAYHIG
jgi:hypothetical protein